MNTTSAAATRPFAVAIPLSRRKLLLLLSFAALFVAAGAFMFSLDDAQILANGRRSPLFVHGVGLAGIVMGGLGLVFIGRKLFDKAPGLVLDPHGLTDNASAAGVGFIPWTAITGVQVGQIHQQRLLYVMLADPDHFLAGFSGPRRALAKAGMRFGPSPVAIPSNALAIDFDAMVALVEKHLAASRRTTDPGTESLSPIDPARVLRGMVDASGPGGGQAAPSQWHLIVHLAAWREPGGDIVEGKRRCVVPVEPVAMREWMKRMPAYSIVEFEIAEFAIGADGARGRSTKLKRVLRTNVADPELEAIAARLRSPIERDHPRFGTLRYDRRLRNFEAQVDWNGQDVRLCLESPDPERPDGAIDVAEALFDDAQSWHGRVQARAIADLLALKNDKWLAVEEMPVTPDQFRERMRLAAISVGGDGFTFWLDDGGMFSGRSIEVGGDLDTGLREAMLAG